MVVPQPQQLQTLPPGGVFWYITPQIWGMVTGPLASGQMPWIHLDTGLAAQNGGSDMVLYFPNSSFCVKS